MNRYLMYVFNDHFVIVLLFLAGAAGYFYSGYLKQITEMPLILLLGGILMLSLVMIPGDIGTLLEKADVIFLTPLESEMHGYFKKMKHRSLILPFLLEAGITAALMPLFVVGTELTFKDTGWLIASAWLLKGSDMEMRVHAFSLPDDGVLQRWHILYTFFAFSVFSLSVFISPLFGPIAAGIILITIQWTVKNRRKEKGYEWASMIQHETERLGGQYRLLNLFTDVPLVETRIKRNKWMDRAASFLFQFTKKSGQSGTFDYLYQRVFTRNPSYRNLYLRLLGIGILLQVYAPFPVLNVIMGVLFLYLIGFQLIPLATHFNGQVFAALYPVSHKEKEQSLVRLVGILLYTAACIQGTAGFAGMNWKNAVGSFLVQILFCFFFTTKYLPKRLMKLYSE